MKRLCLLMLLIMTGLSLFAVETVYLNSGSNGYRLLSSDDSETRIQYNIGSFEKSAIVIDGKEFYNLNLPKEGITQDKGYPQLPVFNRSIIIPDRAKMKLDVYDVEYEDIPMAIAPSKGVITRDQNPASIPFTFADMYNANLFYPAQIAQLSEPYIMRDLRGITIQSMPFAYNPVAKMLRVYTSYKIRIYSDGNDTINTLAGSRAELSRAFLPLYENHFINYENYRYTPVSDSFGKLLVICHTNYLTQIAPYVNWKKQKGVETELIQWSTIGTTAAQLQTYIQNRYNSDNTITYIQLVGDAPQIPSLSSGGGGSDPTFSLVAGSDNYPDIFIGRFSAETTAEVTAQINKAITYERDLTTSATWLSQAVGIASSEGGGSQGDNGESDIVHMNGIRTKLMNYGYSSVDQIYDPGASAATVTTNVNAGRGFINYVGHGSNTTWVTTGFSNTNALALTNGNKTPVIMDVACVNGNFVGITCFAEAWMRNANGGAVTIYASTINQSWNSPMRAQDEMTDLITTEQKFTAGGLYYNSSCKMMDIYGNTTGSDGVNMFKTWHIFGDAALLVRSKTPQTMAVSHPASIIIGATSINVSTGIANALVALTYNNAIYARGYTNSSGNATLTLVNAPQTALNYTITATALNRVTYIGTVQQLPGTGPFMTVSNTTYADANNNTAEYNESGRFNITFQNIGAVSASNVTATLTCSTSGIIISDAQETISSLASGASTTINNAFAFTIANNIVNGTSAAFTITMVSGTNTWVHEFNISINAPALSFGNMLIQDPTGNNNGRIDPGETVTILIPLNNSGAAASPNGSATLTSSTNGITINSGTSNFSTISPAGSANQSFSVSASSSMSVGTAASFVFAATAGAYTANKTESSAIGLIMEDFESGNFNSFPWTFGGNLPWTVVNTGAYAGSYAAKSGTITDNQTSTMETTRVLTTGGTLSFWYKVSSEASYDYLKFYVDGVLQNSPGWAGTIDWTQATYTLSAGTRTLKWEYYKDGTVSGGSDCAWIDNITFPASTAPSVFNAPQNLVALAGNAVVNLSWNAPASGTPSSYKVYRNSVHLASANALTFADTNVINENTYSYYIVAVYSTPNVGESDPSNIVQATPSANPMQEITIGSATTTQSYPIDRYYNYSTHESIYLASEIGRAGNITKMAYYKGSGTDVNAIQSVTIYMKNSSDATLATGTYSTSGYTQVYSGSFPNTASSGWMEITLGTPFAYNGTSNLAILIVKGNQAWINVYPMWRYSTSSTTRARRSSSDTAQPTSLTSTTYLPNIRFTMQIAAEPQALAQVNPTSITETLDAGNTITNTIALSNPGTANLIWQIQDRDIVLRSAGADDSGIVSSSESMREMNRPASWCNVSPTSGTVLPGQSVNLSVDFDTAGMADGTFTSAIVINSNATNNPSLNIALSMTVQTPVNPYPVNPRFVAEFDPAKAALIRYPFGQPYSLIRDLAVDDLLYVICPSANQASASNLMTANGVNMTNVRWINAATDSYWTRDYGPWFIFDAENEMKIVDFNYNRPRPNDNAIPVAVANNLGVAYYTMDLNHTGGNIMTDGYGMAASTDLVVSENSSLSTAQIRSKMNTYLGVSDYQLYADPNNTYIDHIDCWAKLIDVDKVIVRSVPTSHAQYAAIEAVAAEFASKTSSWGTPYKVFRVYTPGNEPYSNSYILNKKIFVPQMGTANDAAALQVYRNAMPGYTVTGYTHTNYESTDAIHCRVNSIPDDQMIHIMHTPLNSISSNQSVSIDLRIQNVNTMDLNQSYVAWKHSSLSDWQYSTITNTSSHDWISSLPTPEYGDTLFYMIKASDVTGRNNTVPLCGTLDPFKVVATTVGSLITPQLEITDMSGTIQLSWNAVPGAVSYRIMKSNEPDGTYSEIGLTTHTNYQISIGERTSTGFYKVIATTQSR